MPQTAQGSTCDWTNVARDIDSLQTPKSGTQSQNIRRGKKNQFTWSALLNNFLKVAMKTHAEHVGGAEERIHDQTSGRRVVLSRRKRPKSTHNGILANCKQRHPSVQLWHLSKKVKKREKKISDISYKLQVCACMCEGVATTQRKWVSKSMCLCIYIYIYGLVCLTLRVFLLMAMYASMRLGGPPPPACRTRPRPPSPLPPTENVLALALNIDVAPYANTKFARSWLWNKAIIINHGRCITHSQFVLHSTVGIRVKKREVPTNHGRYNVHKWWVNRRAKHRRKNNLT